ncbi:MAG: sigma-54 dependent transcriptional regulator [Candidatus Alcyoniella australis]|nr:sigma-54 dependent transcriptional regulator [Candidatus Alcyoniella australis]
MSKRVLVVDDEQRIRETLAGVLRDEGFDVVVAADGEQALKIAAESAPDVVLLDIWMPGRDGMSVLEQLKRERPEIEVIMISGHGNIETAVKATKLGAYDFVEKPISLPEIVLTIEHVIEMQRLKMENMLLRERFEQRYELVGRSAKIEAVSEQIELVAPTEGYVLITGENGTGKELVARQIHISSRRSSGPFVEVNCAAIPEELIESELFGHEKGSFTGATARRKGKFDMADNGTLFLDEIADMSLKTQAKVLRILQEQVFERVGGVEPISVDVRIIAATNKDLQQLMARRQFREDLYYRLNVVPIHVPPLRERLEDVELFVEAFSTEFAARSALPLKSFKSEAVTALRAHSWPGNVRELKNIVERLLIMTRGEQIEARNVQEALSGVNAVGGLGAMEAQGLREARAMFEREYLLRKLSENNFNVTHTAAAIGVERTHLHRKIKGYGIELSAERAGGGDEHGD